MPTPESGGREMWGSAKIHEINNLLTKLKSESAVNILKPQERLQTLARLKVLGREPQNSDPIFTVDGIETLARASLGTSAPVEAREGLRCLSNALFLKAETRQHFVNGKFTGPVAELLKSEELEDQFLAARLLFLLTYETNVDFEEIDKEHQLCATMTELINKHCKTTSQLPLRTTRPRVELDALTEILKLLFNLTHHYAALCTALSHCAAPILTLLLHEAKVNPLPLQSPTTYLINALMNLPLPSPSITQPTDAGYLVNILDRTTTSIAPAALDETLAPLIELLRRIYTNADSAVRTQLETDLLPRAAERSAPLGTGPSLAARLLRLSVAASAPTLKEPISALLFELSGRDADTLVRNIGYGFAAGFLASRGLAVPSAASASIAGAANTAPESVAAGRGGVGETAGPEHDGRSADVNFVTGQFVDREPALELPEMTEEEKLLEAERLFTLFERLRATGVVDIENPVTVAAREGRLEELPD